MDGYLAKAIRAGELFATVEASLTGRSSGASSNQVNLAEPAVSPRG